MDPEWLRRPRQWSLTAIARFMICIGPISSIFDITTYPSPFGREVFHNIL